jgi:predicted dehydrogenase
VYGTRGSAILEPFDPSLTLRIARQEASESMTLVPVDRQEMYNRELTAFVAVIRGERQPDRSPEHDLAVQETLLRATGRLAEV